jgi:hypothetical protein
VQTKLSKLKQYMAAGDYRAALRLAASWGELGDHKETIQKGRAADVHPEFYLAIGENPVELVAAGIAAIRERYHLEGSGNATLRNDG